MRRTVANALRTDCHRAGAGRSGLRRHRRVACMDAGRRRAARLTRKRTATVVTIVMMAVIAQRATGYAAESPAHVAASEVAGQPAVPPPGETKATLSAVLETMLRHASRDARYVPVAAAELQRAEGLFARTLGGEMEEPALQQRWQALGWELVRLEPREVHVWVLYEQNARKEGRGLFAFRQGARTGIVLESPHAFYDRHTREIAVELFAQGDIAVCGWNTVHRSTYDMAHAADNYMTALTRAVVAVDSRTLVVQLHGFSKKKRRAPAGAAADVILSDGTRTPSPWLLAAGTLLKRHGSLGAVATFPRQVRELGGTTNTQGRAMRQFAAGRFLHLEMSRPVRTRLVRDRSACRQLLKDLVAIYRTSPR